MVDRLKEFVREIKSKDRNAGKVVELITRYGGIEGEHHKQWLLDQTMMALLGPKDYKAWRSTYDNYKDKDGEKYDEWDKGIAP
ncbi:MAG: hypothetical protein V1887_01195 [Candidatus Aenigmatarchaeota archaeon]